jgi:hypothetical protein
VALNLLKWLSKPGAVLRRYHVGIASVPESTGAEGLGGVKRGFGFVFESSA